MKKVIPAYLLAVIAVIIGCVPPPATNRRTTTSRRAPAPPPPSTCNAIYPHGIAYGSPFAVSRFSVVFRITASYTFKDPNLAHEAIPRIFVADMNVLNPAIQYYLADGTNGNLTIYLNVTQDATADHYGMSTQVWGPPAFTFTSPGAPTSTVSFFIFNNDALYVTGDKLISDAATRATGYLNGGWTCGR